MTRRSRSSAGVVGQSLPVSRVAVAASFQTDSWQVILGHGGHGSSETYGSLVSWEEFSPVPGSSPTLPQRDVAHVTSGWPVIGPARQKLGSGTGSGSRLLGKPTCDANCYDGVQYEHREHRN